MSSKKSKTLLAALAAMSIAAMAVVAVGAGADHRASGQYRANLSPVPHAAQADGGSNARGSAKLVRRGSRVQVVVNARGVSPRLPHAMHIHGKEAAGEIARCPGADRRDDIVDDNLIETAEGLGGFGETRQPRR